MHAGEGEGQACLRLLVTVVGPLRHEHAVDGALRRQATVAGGRIDAGWHHPLERGPGNGGRRGRLADGGHRRRCRIGSGTRLSVHHELINGEVRLGRAWVVSPCYPDVPAHSAGGQWLGFEAPSRVRLLGQDSGPCRAVRRHLHVVAGACGAGARLDAKASERRRLGQLHGGPTRGAAIATVDPLGREVAINEPFVGQRLGLAVRRDRDER
ncbi:hypothetical protein D3C72_669870 [compost metagenome]